MKSAPNSGTPAYRREQLARGYLEAACHLYELDERDESTRLFMKAAALGSLEAQVNLANIYDDGDGLLQDVRKAHYWYKRAIAGGSSQGAYNLGISFRNSGNTRWAAYWLNKARDMGDADAEAELRGL